MALKDDVLELQTALDGIDAATNTIMTEIQGLMNQIADLSGSGSAIHALAVQASASASKLAAIGAPAVPTTPPDPLPAA